MATVTGYTADRMKQIEDETVVMGEVDAGGNLVLTTRAGVQIDAGHVKGADATALMTVGDTDTIDLTLSGAGTPASPWLITANQKTQIHSALLDPTYVGPGPARVTFLSGGGLSTEYYQWVGKYEPWGNRVVSMMRQDNSWVIMGHSGKEGYGGKIPFPALNGWASYNEYNRLSWNRWAEPRVQKLPSGIVVLSGLLGYGSPVTAGALIGRLPAGYWPDTAMMFPINNGDTPKAVVIRADGYVQIEGPNWTGNTYISLDGIAFPAAGVATWTEVGSGGSAYSNSWVAHHNATFGVPRFWKDPYGFTWLAGLLANGSTASDNLPMITLPTGYGSDLQSHNKAASNNSFGFVGSGNDVNKDTVNWKTGTTSNAWLSLCGVVLATPDAINNNPWVELSWSNGWVNYGAQFPSLGILRRGDGLGMSKGLIRAGTAPPIKVSNLRAQHMPDGAFILYGVSAQTFCRLDFRGRDEPGNAGDDRGAMYAQTGSNAWISYDNQVWMVGD